MDFDGARKKVAAAKAPNNYLLIRLDYSTQIILPYKAGLQFLQALENAEELNERYDSPKRIVPITRERIRTEVMSATEYQAFKMAALLDMNPQEIFDQLQQSA